ncbi:MAG TPA: metallophosphoesterase family protein [Blastocatellia bacterium]|nr:metallophosphoesterase family protein [Blastocatellia bacterium]
MGNEERLRRIGAIGDIHAEDARLETALRFLKGQNLDLMVAVGDITDGPGDVGRCCELLRAYQVAAVRGNHERWFLRGVMRDLPDATESVDDRTWAYLVSLPLTRDFETVAGRLMLCHGLAHYDMGGASPGNSGNDLESLMVLDEIRKSGESRFIINGHTHRRMVRSFDGLTIINAGTIFRQHEPCFLIADFEAGHVQFYDLGDNALVTEGELFQLPR